MRSIELRGASTKYVVAPTPCGSGVQAVCWGDAELPEPLPTVPARPEFDTPEDLYPHEFAVDGTRHVLESELRLHTVDGAQRGALVHLADLQVVREGRHVTARLAGGGVQVDLAWITSEAHDVVRRQTVVHNVSRAAIVLDRALTGAFNLALPDGAAVDLLAGSWCAEYTPLQAALPRGTFRLESRQGLNSHLVAPVVTVTDPRAPERGVWSVAVAWPGSFELNVHATSRAGWVRVSGGLLSEDPVVLEPGESLALPELQGLWAPNPNEAARRWHAFQRGELLRSSGDEQRPVTYNSWYATEFDVSVEQQLSLATVAAGLGCEAFVLDDGWFKGRTGDVAGLGDWSPDPQTFPDGLAPLIEQVHRLGMRFGLWIEPEGVNPDSDLFRAHPDWIHRSASREPVLIRNQYVLNLGLPEVEEWVRATLRRVLTGTGVDHLKWDMNRAITDGGQPLDPRAGEWSLRHSEAYLRILGWLRAEFPAVTLETCAGGGARVSNAVLPLTDVVWPSDETGSRDRLEIQHGFLSVFPAAVMSSWVTHLDGTRDSRRASLIHRFLVAMCGVLSVGADLHSWSSADLELARRLIAVYKEIREIVFEGRVGRHGLPREHGYAVEFELAGRSVILVFGEPGSGAAVALSPSFSAASEPLEALFGCARWDGAALAVELDPEVGACLISIDAQPGGLARLLSD